MSTHHEVAHNFANRTGKARNGHNMFHTDRSIYSYGGHFEIARHVDGVVLMTTREYSVSTSQHQSAVRGACSHLTVFTVPCLDVSRDASRGHNENLTHYRECFISNLERSTRRRSASLAEYDIASAESMADAHKAYCKFFRLRRAPLRRPDMVALKAKIAVKAKEQAARNKIANERKEAARVAELTRVHAVDVPRWLAGEHVYLPYDMPTLCRVVGDNIETSKRASFPVSDARVAYPKMVLLAKLSATAKYEGKQHNMVPRELIKLGNFKVDHVNTRGIKSGCHFVEWKSIIRTAREIGLTD